ncbi:hypothetical protein NDU88_004508 [Pleurodeles waltl]|uniref:Uncharacterized protein n=1 Tax=Pleurodeles waltl TaxID=8319 RepID=A0AAV7NJS2_PLEWA|nr:hypothetical protein NDU88_004508 [Pleurodeles waltl]
MLTATLENRSKFEDGSPDPIFRSAREPEAALTRNFSRQLLGTQGFAATPQITPARAPRGLAFHVDLKSCLTPLRAAKLGL